MAYEHVDGAEEGGADKHQPFCVFFLVVAWERYQSIPTDIKIDENR